MGVSSRLLSPGFWAPAELVARDQKSQHNTARAGRLPVVDTSALQGFATDPNLMAQHNRVLLLNGKNDTARAAATDS